MKRTRDARIFLVVVFTFVSFVLARNEPVLGYGIAEHWSIGADARDNYRDHVDANPNTAVGRTAITNYWANIRWGLENEDVPATNCREHFWNPDGGDDDGFLWYHSAWTRANNYWNNDLLPQYGAGNYLEAYRVLGRIAHLIMDMGVPAHSNLDPHTPTEWYEQTYMPAHSGNFNVAGITSGTLYNLMRDMAEISDNFDSSNVDGEVDAGSRRDTNGDGTPDFTNAEGAQIANACYLGAITRVGGFFQLFYNEVRPEARLTKPQQEEVRSGIIGIDFKARARSYSKTFLDADFIKHVEFGYATVDAPTTSDWASIGTDDTFDVNKYYTWHWTNSINDDKVWVEVIAVDNGDLESLPVRTWIKIDSERPKIVNTQP